MSATANKVFVIATFVLSLVCTVVIATWGFFTMTNPSANGRGKTWLSWAIITLLCFAIYPFFFMSIDILDARVCSGANAIVVKIGGISEGCNIPVGAIWDTLLGANFCSCFLIMPYLRFLRLNHQRRREIRIAVAAGAAIACILAACAVTAVIWAIPGTGLFRAPELSESMVSTCICSEENGPTKLTASDCSCSSMLQTCDSPAALEDDTSFHGSSSTPMTSNATEEHDCMGDPAAQGYSDQDPWPGFEHSAFTPFDALVKVWAVLGLFITIPIVSVGLVYYPWSFIAAFVNRPKIPLSKSDYISAARALFLTAKEIKRTLAAMVEYSTEDLGLLEKLQFKWHLHNLDRKLTAVELQAQRIDSQYPQGDDPELTWTLSLILTWARLLYGIVTALASLLWIANFALFLIPRTPIFFVMNYLISFRDSEKSFGAYILNCLDLVFLAFMTLYLVICATSGAMYLKDRIEVFKNIAFVPGFMTIMGVLDVIWPLVFVLPSLLWFETQNLKSAMEGTKMLDVLAHSQAQGTWFSGASHYAFFSTYLMIWQIASYIGIPVAELWFPRPHRQPSSSVLLLSHDR